MFFFFPVLSAIGFFSFSFALWQRLKDDYPPDLIFKLTLILLSAGVTLFLVSDRFVGMYQFWFFVLGLLLSLFYGIKKLEMRMYEVLDSVVLGFLWLTVFFSLGRIMFYGIGDQFSNLLESVAAMVSIVVYYFLAREYRKFSWYPSGKIGFTGLSSSAFYFLCKGFLAVYFFLSLSLQGTILDVILSFAIVSVATMTVYLRSGRKNAEKIISIVERRAR